MAASSAFSSFWLLVGAALGVLSLMSYLLPTAHAATQRAWATPRSDVDARHK